MRSSSVPASQRSRPMSAPSEPAQPRPRVRDGGARAALPVDGAEAEIGDASADDDEEKHPVPVPIPPIEAAEELMKGIFMSLLTNGDSDDVRMAVIRKLKSFLDLIREARRTRMDRVLYTIQEEATNQEEATRAEVPVNQRHAASCKEPTSPPSRYFPLLNSGSSPRVPRRRSVSFHIPNEPTSRSCPKTETKSGPSSPKSSRHKPHKPQEVQTQTREAVRQQRAEAARVIQEAQQQSLATKRERAARSRMPNDGPTRSSIGEKAEDESSIATSASTRPQKARVAPPSASSAYEQRRQALQKQKAEMKAQREWQAQEAARKQREDIKRMAKEAKQKEQAAMEERLARLRIQRKSSFKTK